MDYVFITLVGLIALSVVLIVYAIMYNSIANEKKSGQRMKSFQGEKKSSFNSAAHHVDEKQRRKTRENTLKNVEAQRASGKKAANPPLRVRIVQAGMDVSLEKFYLIGVMICFGVGALTYVMLGAPWFIAAGLAVAAGFGMPVWFINFKRKRRFSQFTLIFPNAIDVIVRGIRSGLPLNDCLRIIASDSEEPVRGEFRKIIEATQMGITVPDACGKLYDNVPTAETNFFAIVVAIQSAAGGNLSEALGNLSKVLRERRKMADKVTAFSTEAKTSAIIIGSLPFIVAILVHLSTPDYLIPLFETTSGHEVLLFCAISMAVGTGVMKKMINFKF